MEGRGPPRVRIRETPAKGDLSPTPPKPNGALLGAFVVYFDVETTEVLVVLREGVAFIVRGFEHLDEEPCQAVGAKARAEEVPDSRHGTVIQNL